MTAPVVLSVAVSGRGVVEVSDPVLAADDEGFTRGRAAFETTRVYGGRPFRFTQHVDRLVASAARIGLEPVDRADIERLAELALGAARATEATLRLYWTPGSPGGPARGIAIVGSIPEWIEQVRERGQRLVSLLQPRRSAPWLLPATKSTSYAVNIAAEAEAKARGADDAVFVDEQGIVLEGPVTNIWWREGDVLLTPSLELGILAGETRAALLGLATQTGWVVEEGMFHLERLWAADEAFSSSSVREVMPVVQVDGRTIGRGSAAMALQEALRREARG